MEQAQAWAQPLREQEGEERVSLEVCLRRIFDSRQVSAR